MKMSCKTQVNIIDCYTNILFTLSSLVVIIISNNAVNHIEDLNLNNRFSPQIMSDLKHNGCSFLKKKTICL